MKRLVVIAMCTGFMCVTAQAMADEPMRNKDSSTPSEMSQTHTSKKQMMKDCMAKEQAKNSGASKDDMKKTCKEQMKMQRETKSSS